MPAYPHGLNKLVRTNLYRDIGASLVVFLVALPLCIGIALASGVPAELGVITGIVGGLLVGALPGSSFQVSGPAAGLTVLVYEAVTEHGAETLGVIVLTAGVLQILLGAARLGRWFQAISLAVVQGMLAGIGLLLIAGQAYALADRKPAGTATENLLGLPGLVADVARSGAGLTAAGLGVLTIALIVLWAKAPRPLRTLPGPLVAVVAVSVLAVVAGADAQRLEVGTLTAAIRPPEPDELGRLLDPAVFGTVLAFALIASAESLFSAAAVDRMHSGPRTRYNAELVAQGVGNSVCGLLGALPMTAVIVRSAANVHAGARTKLSRVLHGGWLLAFALFLPGVLELIPVAVLAGVLIHSGWKLLSPQQVAWLWRQDRGEALVMAVTTAAIVATNLLEGVLIGMVAAVVKCAWDVSHLKVSEERRDDRIELRLAGNATFLRLPRIVEILDALPATQRVELDLSGLRHLDHACLSAVESWAEQRRTMSLGEVRIQLPPVDSRSVPEREYA
ncbi:sulfate transporter [Carbonactinospora thermoautotrophica]|uniref:SulP family inorganic anion transporter n=1 Tax=Carbonactinospora thermoautotrophica TaxID=1469144 RepID=UPI0022722AE2|nr:sulfate transporter [Carbonactinospora thermoautotrophica]